MNKESINKNNDDSLLESFVEGTDTIAPEEREKIFNEIEHVVAQNAREVTPDQFIVNASRKGFKFPLIVNAVLIVLLVLVVSVVTVYAGKQRKQFLYSIQDISVASGSALVSSIIEENQAKVTAREEALKTIQDQLDDLLSGQKSIDETYAQRINQFKEQQDISIDNQLQGLRATLESEQVKESDIQKRLKEQRIVLVNEYESKLQSYTEQQNKEKIEREKAMSIQIDKLQSQQVQRKSEIDALQEEIKKSKEELEEQQGKANEELANVKSQLASLAKNKEERKRQLDKLAIYYDNVTSAIAREDYTGAQAGIADARDAIIDSDYKTDEKVQLYLSLYSFYETLIEKILVQGQSLSEAEVQELLDTQSVQASSLRKEIELSQQEIDTLRTDYNNEQQKLIDLQNKYDISKEKNLILQNDFNDLEKVHNKLGNEFIQNVQGIIEYLNFKKLGIVDPVFQEEINQLINSELSEFYFQIGNSLARKIDTSGTLEFP